MKIIKRLAQLWKLGGFKAQRYVNIFRNLRKQEWNISARKLFDLSLMPRLRFVILVIRHILKFPIRFRSEEKKSIWKLFHHFQTSLFSLYLILNLTFVKTISVECRVVLFFYLGSHTQAVTSSWKNIWLFFWYRRL